MNHGLNGWAEIQSRFFRSEIRASVSSVVEIDIFDRSRNPQCRIFQNEIRKRGHRHHRRKRPLPDRGIQKSAGHQIETPFGAPSDAIIGGKLTDGSLFSAAARAGASLAAARTESSRQHLCPPFAERPLDHLRDRGRQPAGKIRAARCLLALAVLRPHQSGADHTFFGDGIAAHVSFAEPICTQLARSSGGSGDAVSVRVHNGGTYVNMDGPAFSTRAESELNRRQASMSSA